MCRNVCWKCRIFLFFSSAALPFSGGEKLLTNETGKGKARGLKVFPFTDNFGYELS
jgi:hypothetical protein